eukprot:m.232949 g.232949  ORF g.232949 m.232949 type:complete len:84 (-) comp19284_c0_seq12:476-727(-)
MLLHAHCSQERDGMSQLIDSFADRSKQPGGAADNEAHYRAQIKVLEQNVADSRTRIAELEVLCEGLCGFLSYSGELVCGCVYI